MGLLTVVAPAVVMLAEGEMPGEAGVVGGIGGGGAGGWSAVGGAEALELATCPAPEAELTPDCGVAGVIGAADGSVGCGGTGGWSAMGGAGA